MFFSFNFCFFILPLFSIVPIDLFFAISSSSEHRCLLCNSRRRKRAGCIENPIISNCVIREIRLLNDFQSSLFRRDPLSHNYSSNKAYPEFFYCLQESKTRKNITCNFVIPQHGKFVKRRKNEFVTEVKIVLPKSAGKRTQNFFLNSFSTISFLLLSFSRVDRQKCGCPHRLYVFHGFPAANAMQRCTGKE